MEIKVLGPGCYTCQELTTHVELAVEQIGIQATVQHVHDYETYATYDILFTPGLLIDGKLVSAGRVPTVKQLMALLAPVPVDES
jgi:small redox-active disulfide protein 2